MANQRTTNKTTPPTYKKHTSAAGQKTEISNNNGKVTTKVTQKGGDYAIKVVEGKKTYYKTFDKSGKETTGKKPVPVKSTEAKVTTPKKLTTEQTDKIPFKNDAINKFSDKVYPIWQGLERNEIDSKGNTRQPVRTAINKKEAQKPWLYQSTMYGTEAQRDSSRAVVTGMNIKKTTGGKNIFVSPDKKNPLVKPGDTKAGALVKRTSAENNAQLRANKRLTGKTGDGY